MMNKFEPQEKRTHKKMLRKLRIVNTDEVSYSLPYSVDVQKIDINGEKRAAIILQGLADKKDIIEAIELALKFQNELVINSGGIHIAIGDPEYRKEMLVQEKELGTSYSQIAEYFNKVLFPSYYDEFVKPENEVDISLIPPEFRELNRGFIIFRGELSGDFSLWLHLFGISSLDEIDSIINAGIDDYIDGKEFFMKDYPITKEMIYITIKNWKNNPIRQYCIFEDYKKIMGDKTQ